MSGNLILHSFVDALIWMGFSLLICMSVLARNILSPRPFSFCSYVCIGLPRPAHPPKVKYSLSAGKIKGKAKGVQAIRLSLSNCLNSLGFSKVTLPLVHDEKLPKWNILSLLVRSREKPREFKQLDCLCLIAWTPLAFPLILPAEREYFTLGGCAGPGRPIHT